MPEPGTSATNFCLPDKDGNETCLKDFKGKWVVFYFYPKDGCGTEKIRQSFTMIT
jgi:thioredoxin-dependent peroxiredoxin